MTFIGLDLAENRSDYARLDEDLNCSFGKWEYREDGSGLPPVGVNAESSVIAIDGPQGLAGCARAPMRVSEWKLSTPGRSPSRLPDPTKPYAGFTRRSVALFTALVQTSHCRLLGLDGTRPRDATLIEVFPGAAWKVLSDRVLPAKRRIDGRKARRRILEDLGLQLDCRTEIPTHDQLDAAIAAWIAYRLRSGKADLIGKEPRLDESAAFLREGFIVQPQPLN